MSKCINRRIIGLLKSVSNLLQKSFSGEKFKTTKKELDWCAALDFGTTSQVLFVRFRFEGL